MYWGNQLIRMSTHIVYKNKIWQKYLPKTTRKLQEIQLHPYQETIFGTITILTTLSVTYLPLLLIVASYAHISNYLPVYITKRSWPTFRYNHSICCRDRENYGKLQSLGHWNQRQLKWRQSYEIKFLCSTTSPRFGDSGSHLCWS
jgi:hypothetical protein